MAAAVTGVSGQKKEPEAVLKSYSVVGIAERLATLVHAGHQSDNSELVTSCLALARGIDSAIANNEVPPKAQDLPSLLKQVCNRASGLNVRAAIMVLMISVKSACKVGWFPLEESEELLALANQVSLLRPSFCSPGDSHVRSPRPSFYQTMGRFYPFVKILDILVSLEVEPGYRALMADFYISKIMLRPPQKKILLFVARTDDIETSACIINPQQANFFINGKGVEKRTNVSMDSGPQLPTNVGGMLKYGTNLLQAVGQFNGHFIIILAFTEVISPAETPVLNDCIQSGIVELNSDSDIMEGPSRISLSCPISRTRLKLPVKGLLCKHLQCFDFGNYVHINSRRPSWRCPHCNQTVSYLDIRVDQNMVKVLKEVGENVDDVIISADGSWTAVMESTEKIVSVNETKPDDQQGSARFSNFVPKVVDLTRDNNEIHAHRSSGTDDRIPLVSDLQRQSTANLMSPSDQNHLSAPGYANLQPAQAMVSQHFQQRTLLYGNIIENPTAQASPVTHIGNGLGRLSGNITNEQHFSKASVRSPEVPAVDTSLNQMQNQNRQEHMQRTHQNRYHQSATSQPQFQTLQDVISPPDQHDNQMGDGIAPPVSSNWRPVGRMRGSLELGSSSASMDHMIIRPSQPAQTSEPPASQETASEASVYDI